MRTRSEKQTSSKHEAPRARANYTKYSGAGLHLATDAPARKLRFINKVLVRIIGFLMSYFITSPFLGRNGAAGSVVTQLDGDQARREGGCYSVISDMSQFDKMKRHLR
jgi:hypothetical protein